MNTREVQKLFVQHFILSHMEHAGHMSKLIGKVFNDKLTCFETVLRGEQLFHVNT